MIKIVQIIRCKCDCCGKTVDEHDKFCRVCGYNLKEAVNYEEVKQHGGIR